MNLHNIANRAITAINPNFVGTWYASSGNVETGDDTITASISGTVLTVTASMLNGLDEGSLLTDENFNLLPGTTIVGMLSGTGGVGTYQVNLSQTVASEEMNANGPGTRVPTYTQISNVPMQVQALGVGELQHLDGLNIDGAKRAVYMNGIAQSVQRPNVLGGDLLYIPTGLSSADIDLWLVVDVIEGWDADGWCKVAVQLQMPEQFQFTDQLPTSLPPSRKRI